MKKIIYFLSILFILGSISAHAAEELKTPNVSVGVYVNRIKDFSYKNGTATVDMTIWFRWSDQKLHPNKTFTIKDASIESRKDLYDGQIDGDKSRWAMVDVIATISQKWDLRPYPFDAQTLKIQILENKDDVSNVRYESDSKNITFDKNIKIESWHIKNAAESVSSNIYETSFGSNEKTYTSTALNYVLQLERNSYFNGLKLLIAPIAVMIMLLITSSLSITNPARFFGVVTPTFFVLVTSHILIQNQLPATEVISIAEKIIYFGLTQALIYYLASVLSFNANEKNNRRLYERLQKLLPRLLVAMDIVFVGYVVLQV